MFPTELISAIEAAAPTPLTLELASAQNGPIIDARPAMATDSAATDAAAPVTRAAAIKPAAHTSAAHTMCLRRSPVRSECRPVRTIVIAAAA